MDLNSYLTDFFKLLQNSNNNLYGGNRLTGGALPDGHFCITPKGDGSLPTNAEIIQHYFKIPTTVNNITVDSGLIITDDAAIKADFMANQVDIVDHMLNKNASNNGVSIGLKGGYNRYIYGGDVTGDATPQAAAAAVAAVVNDPAAGAVDPLLACIFNYLQSDGTAPEPTVTMIQTSFNSNFNTDLITPYIATIPTNNDRIIEVKEEIFKLYVDPVVTPADNNINSFIIEIKEAIFTRWV